MTRNGEPGTPWFSDATKQPAAFAAAPVHFVNRGWVSKTALGPNDANGWYHLTFNTKISCVTTYKLKLWLDQTCKPFEPDKYSYQGASEAAPCQAVDNHAQPFFANVLVRPALLDISNSHPGATGDAGPGFTETEAGRLNLFGVVPRDIYGNDRCRFARTGGVIGYDLSDVATLRVEGEGPAEGSSVPALSLSWPKGLEFGDVLDDWKDVKDVKGAPAEACDVKEWMASASPCARGFAAVFSIAQAGVYNIHVSLGDPIGRNSQGIVATAPLQISPYRIVVIPGRADASRSQLVGVDEAAKNCVVSKSCSRPLSDDASKNTFEFFVTLCDQFGNFRLRDHQTQNSDNATLIVASQIPDRHILVSFVGGDWDVKQKKYKITMRVLTESAATAIGCGIETKCIVSMQCHLKVANETLMDDSFCFEFTVSSLHNSDIKGTIEKGTFGAHEYTAVPAGQNNTFRVLVLDDQCETWTTTRYNKTLGCVQKDFLEGIIQIPSNGSDRILSDPTRHVPCQPDECTKEITTRCPEGKRSAVERFALPEKSISVATEYYEYPQSGACGTSQSDASKHYACLQYIIRVTVAADYTVGLQFDGNLGIQWALSVVPAQLVPEKTLQQVYTAQIWGEATAAVAESIAESTKKPRMTIAYAGETTSFLFQTTDRFGNLRLNSDTIACRMSPANEASQEGVDHNHQLNMTIDEFGIWEPKCDCYRVTFGTDKSLRWYDLNYMYDVSVSVGQGLGAIPSAQHPLPHSPYAVMLRPAELDVDPKDPNTSGPGPQFDETEAGRTSVFGVVPRDEFGNTLA
eukprot:COSAG05_NODE_2944_length_2477_cov_55.420101_1_plen_801_part_10